jgi:hypothetical protein
MPVDVSWGGVSLAQGASCREQDGGWFIEVDQPMPVGTRLHLTGDVDADVEVARVHEGAGAGMVVKKTAAAASAPAASAPAASAPAASAAPAGDEADEKEPEKDNGAGAAKKEKRRKRR